MGTPTGSGAHVAVDAMGGDLGPSEIVAATRLALDDPRLASDLILVGQPALLEPLLKQHGLASHSRVRLHAASEVVTMEDKPVQALRRKKDSSMARGFELLKTGEAAAMVSCGNTGALMAGGTIRLRTIEGIDRPALAAIIPRQNGYFILIDAGANPEAEPRHLVHNALLGSHYARVILGVDKPRVGLFTVGTEEGKGNALSKNTHEILKRAHADGLLNYVGPTEGFQAFTDHCDVGVCDGFVGNLLLKSWESLAKFFKSTLEAELKANPLRLAGAALSRGAFKALKARMNPDRYGGAPLLGLRGNVLKAHGSSNRHALHAAILAADKVVRADFLAHVARDTARLNATIATVEAEPASSAKSEPGDTSPAA
jgi:glycerol-3-phosphate acyltransferase PlsX